MPNTLLLHLSLIEGVGPITSARICGAVAPDSRACIYDWSVSDFMHEAQISQAMAEKIVAGLKNQTNLHQELALAQRLGYCWCSIDDPEYPELLKTIYAPPTILYWKGRSPATLGRTVALVGSRQANGYAVRIAQTLTTELVQAGVTIVSGGALGADTFAHKAALHAEGITCAVIGSGLQHPYPASNRDLFERIVEKGGTILSCFPIGMQALPGNFPARNRIIAGMAHATIVLQAAERSGTRSTALYALEQGREVGAVPGNVDDPLSVGCHKLLTEGATVITSAQDVLVMCGWSEPEPQKSYNSRKQEPTSTPGKQASLLENASILRPLRQAQGEREQNERVAPANSQGFWGAKSPKIPSSDPVIQACQTPCLFDELHSVLGCDASWLEERLLTLQLDGQLEQDFSGRWKINGAA